MRLFMSFWLTFGPSVLRQRKHLLDHFRAVVVCDGAVFQVVVTGGLLSLVNFLPLLNLNSAQLGKIYIMLACWAQCQTSWTEGQTQP